MKTKKHCSLEADVRWTPDAKENIETWNQWCSRDRNLRYRDLVKTARPRLHQKSRDSILQILCSLPNFFKMSSSLLSWILLKFLAFFRPVLVVFNLQIQQKKSLNYKNFTKFLQYSKSRDLKPSRPGPKLAKMGLETSLETQTKSQRVHHCM